MRGSSTTTTGAEGHRDYDAVVFDNDGVLIEPPAREVQAEATRRAFEAVGVAAPAEVHVEAIVDGVTIDGLYEICRTYDLDPETFWAAREDHDERSQIERFRAGARTTYDDVGAIADLEPDCGVTSNNHDSTIAFVMEYFDLASLFETYRGREKTIESLELKKPNPHYLERTLATLGVESGLYVGDSESDVIAADRAGMDSVLVRRAHSEDVEPDPEVGPTYEVSDLSDVVAIVEDGNESR